MSDAGLASTSERGVAKAEEGGERREAGGERLTSGIDQGADAKESGSIREDDRTVEAMENPEAALFSRIRSPSTIKSEHLSKEQ